MIHNMDKRLPITEPENQSYFDAILTNDATKVKQIFASATAEKKSKLLTSFFDYSSNRGFVPMNYTQRSFYRPTHPFHVAIGFSSIAVAEVMLQVRIDKQAFLQRIKVRFEIESCDFHCFLFGIFQVIILSPLTISHKKTMTISYRILLVDIILLISLYQRHLKGIYTNASDNRSNI